jgi:hypothetical protein
MERIVLGVILVAALAALARMIWRSVSRAAVQTSPGCAECPFVEKCEMNAREAHEGRDERSPR